MHNYNKDETKFGKKRNRFSFLFSSDSCNLQLQVLAEKFDSQISPFLRVNK